ncbi:MAG: hypothetical protein WKF74_02925 [Pyrinomonadaceae bacterium]
MRRFAVAAVLTLSMSILSLAQVSGKQAARSVNPEQEIISLSRGFAGEAILTHKERAETLDIHDIKVRINGNTALFTSRADLKGQNSFGQAYTYPHQLTVEYVKRGEDWQVIRGEWRKL